MNPTIYDIAKACKFSRSTISRVINGDPKVKKQTRENIQRVIKEMKYSPSGIARSLVKGSTDIVSLIVGDITNPFYVEISKTIQETLYKHGYMTVLCNSDYNIDLENKYIETSIEKNFSGIIMMSATGSDEKLKKAIENNIHIVLVNRYSPKVNTDAVLVDDFKGAYMATGYLISLGHKRIALLNGPQHSTASRNTLEGYIAMMNEAGLEIREGDITEGDLTQRAGSAVGTSILQSKKDITAILCTTDAMATGVIDTYLGCGKKIPEDLSVIGYDWSRLSYEGKIKLTTIGVLHSEIGNVASELIVGRLKKSSKNNEETNHRRIILEPRLIIGDSTKRL